MLHFIAFRPLRGDRCLYFFTCLLGLEWHPEFIEALFPRNLTPSRLDSVNYFLQPIPAREFLAAPGEHHFIITSNNLHAIIFWVDLDKQIRLVGSPCGRLVVADPVRCAISRVHILRIRPLAIECCSKFLSQRGKHPIDCCKVNLGRPPPL